MQIEQILVPTQSSIIQNEYGSSIIEQNRSLFFKVYPRPDIPLCDLCFHVLLGQLPNILTMKYTIQGSQQDLRTHLTIFSPSGTQKGVAFGYIANLCNHLDMHFKPMGLFTDSGLVGYPDGRSNRRTHNDDDDDNENAAYKGDLSRDAISPGIGWNILAWSEGTDVFDVRKFGVNQHTMNILQKAMNTIDTYDNHIDKTTGLGTVSVDPTISLLLVTYPPLTLTSETLGTGFLQRQVVIVRELELLERENTALNAADYINQILPKSDITSLAYKLKVVNKFAETAHLIIPEKVVPYIKTLSSSFFSYIYKKNIIAQAKLGEFASRWAVNILYNIIFHHTLLRLSNEVSYEDVVYAEHLMLPIWYEFCDYIEGVLKHNSPDYIHMQSDLEIIRTAYDCLQQKEVSEQELVSQLSTMWAISDGGALRKLRRYEQYLFDINEVHEIPAQLYDTLDPSEVDKIKHDYPVMRILSMTNR